MNWSCSKTVFDCSHTIVHECGSGIFVFLARELDVCLNTHGGVGAVCAALGCSCHTRCTCRDRCADGMDQMWMDSRRTCVRLKKYIKTAIGLTKNSMLHRTD